VLDLIIAGFELALLFCSLIEKKPRSINAGNEANAVNM
jgi:hypothetical protein